MDVVKLAFCIRDTLSTGLIPKTTHCHNKVKKEGVWPWLSHSKFMWNQGGTPSFLATTNLVGPKKQDLVLENNHTTTGFFWLLKISGASSSDFVTA